MKVSEIAMPKVLFTNPTSRTNRLINWFNRVQKKYRIIILDLGGPFALTVQLLILRARGEMLGLKIFSHVEGLARKDIRFLALGLQTNDPAFRHLVVVNDRFLEMPKWQQEVIVAHEKGHFIHEHLTKGLVTGLFYEQQADQYAAELIGKTKVAFTLKQTFETIKKEHGDQLSPNMRIELASRIACVTGRLDMIPIPRKFSFLDFM